MAVAQCSLKQKKDFVFLKVVYDDYAEPTDSVITREHHFELPFKCNFSRKKIKIWTFFQRDVYYHLCFQKKAFPTKI